MAANFVVMGSFATVQVTGPSSVVDVLRITFRTIPSGVIAFANAPYKNLVGVQPGDVDGVARVFIAPLATGIEHMMGSGEVVAAVADSEPDASGLLIDYIDATVEHPPLSAAQPGPFQQVVRIPTQFFDEPSFYDALIGHKIDAAYQALAALAAA